MQTTVRLADAKDSEKFVEWQYATPDNLFDSRIVDYPSLRTLAVEQDGETLTYVPFHPVIVVESLAHKPEISPKQNAVALRKAQDELEAIARGYGMAEVWWMCADESLIRFAARHGYEVVPTKVLRKRIDPCV